jgi:outer membrane biosynthesis protein TonB
MIELVKSPSTRVPSKGRLALWLVVSLVLAALLFAACAQAQGTSAPEGAAETSTGEAATATEATPPTPESALPTSEPAPPTAEATPPAPEPALPTTEATPPTPEPAPPATEPAPPATVPVEPAPPTTTEPTPPPVEKKSVEQAASGAVAEAVAEDARGAGEGSEVSASGSDLTHRDTTDEVAPEIPAAVTTPTTVAVGDEISMVYAQNQSSLPSSPRAIAAHRAGQLSWEIAAIGASITAGNVGRWLDISSASSVSATSFVAGGGSPTAIASGAPAGGRGGDSAVESHPSTPTPGPGSGGAGGGSAAGGGSGAASSASFTLVGVLLQAAPRAMRRLCLAQPSWRTSFFVLIPERPD